MNTSRHPAGTSLGGQWAPGSAGEVEDTDDYFEHQLAPVTDPASAQATLRRFPDEDEDSGVDEGLAGRLDRESLTDVSEGLASSMNFASAAHREANPSAHPRYSGFFATAGEPVDEDATDKERAQHFNRQAQAYKALRSKLGAAADPEG